MRLRLTSKDKRYFIDAEANAWGELYLRDSRVVDARFKWQRIHKVDIGRAGIIPLYKVIDTAPTDPLADALRECITEGGAYCLQGDTLAQRVQRLQSRIAQINKIASDALKG